MKRNKNSKKIVTNEEHGVGFLKKVYKSIALLGIGIISIYSNTYSRELF